MAAAEIVYEIDRYEILRPLGQGGFGAVYLARHRMTGREVALKVSDPQGDPELVARALNEARVMATTRHPSLVDVFDCGSLPDGRIFVAMERVEGRSLEALLEAEGRIAPERAVHIAVQVLSALDAVHQRGVIHRDIKPGNILVRREPDGRERAFVIDFGISKVQSSEPAGRSQPATVAGAVLGTPGFMAPEQLDARSVDARADVYGVGAVLFCAITGRAPYEARSIGEWLYQITQTAAPMLETVAPWVNPALALVVNRALARDRDARPPSAKTMAEALIASLHGSSIATDRTVVQPAYSAATLAHKGPSPTPAPGGWSASPASAHAWPPVATAKLPVAAGPVSQVPSQNAAISYAPTAYAQSARGAVAAPSVRAGGAPERKSVAPVVALVSVTALVTTGVLLGVVRPWEASEGEPAVRASSPVEFVGPRSVAPSPMVAPAPSAVVPVAAGGVGAPSSNALAGPAPRVGATRSAPRAEAPTTQPPAQTQAIRGEAGGGAPSIEPAPRQSQEFEDVALLRSASGRLRFVSGRPVGAVDMSAVLAVFRRAMTGIEACYGGSGPARISLVLLFRSHAPPMFAPSSQGGALARCAANAIEIAHGPGGSSHGGILTDAVFEWRATSR
ncbi:MAG: protein kinase [Myxococcales bacterium]|nr:protein kinase [Myxococcales bacterium]